MKPAELFKRLNTLQVGDVIFMKTCCNQTMRGEIKHIKYTKCSVSLHIGKNIHIIPIDNKDKCPIKCILLLQEACTHHGET